MRSATKDHRSRRTVEDHSSLIELKYITDHVELQWITDHLELYKITAHSELLPFLLVRCEMAVGGPALRPTAGKSDKVKCSDSALCTVVIE